MLCLPVMAGTKYYKDFTKNHEVQDTSGLKTLEQLKIDFNCPNLQDITEQREAELAISQTILNQSKAQQAIYEAQKQQDIETNLPTWQQVSDAIDNATTIAQLKAILKKQCRIIYWLAKNKQD